MAKQDTEAAAADLRYQRRGPGVKLLAASNVETQARRGDLEAAAASLAWGSQPMQDIGRANAAFSRITAAAEERGRKLLKVQAPDGDSVRCKRLFRGVLHRSCG